MRKFFIKSSDLIEEDLSDIISESDSDYVTPAGKKRPVTMPTMAGKVNHGEPAPIIQPAAPIKPVANDRMVHDPSMGPTLASRHRPDLQGSIAGRALAHFSHYNNSLDPRQPGFNRVGTMRGGANAIFHANTTGGRDYAVKSLHGAAEGHEPEHWASRNIAANEFLDAMGAGHMGVEGFQSRVPHEGSMAGGKKILKPGPEDDPRKVKGMHFTHADKPAFVTRMVPNAVALHRATPAMMKNINGEHRLAGIVHHVVTGSADAHHGNVLYDTANKHPVHIDNDLSYDSAHAQAALAHKDNHEKLPGLMSVYTPGEDLDYRKGTVTDPETGQEKEMGEVGKNYPPHIQKALERAASGELGGGLSDKDRAMQMKNAQDLLDHGLEGTLKNRFIMPTYKKRDEDMFKSNTK